MANRSPRRFLTRLILLIVIVIAAVALILPRAPLDRFKPRIESALSHSLGRKVTVSTMHLELLYRPALVMDGLVAAEDPQFGEGNLLEANQARAEIAIGPLLAHREIVVKNLALDSPRLTFSKDANGAWSWATIGQHRQRESSSMRSPENSSPDNHSLSTGGINEMSMLMVPGRGLVAGPIPDGIDGVNINNATIKLVDNSDSPGWSSTYTNISMTARLTPSSPGTPGSAMLAEGKLTASSNSAEGGKTLTANLPFSLQIAAQTHGGISVQGDIGPGNVETDSFSAANFKSAVSLQGQKITFTDVGASLYDGDLKGQFALDMADPKVGFDAQGQVHNLNLDQAFGGKLGIPGKITGHVDATFTLKGEVGQFPASIATVTGNGQMSSNDLFLGGVDLGRQIAQKLAVAPLGTTRSGVSIAHAESAFEINHGLIAIENLKLNGLGGLGDAVANQGWLKISTGANQTSVDLNFPSTVTLSPETTTTIANSNPLYGAAIALLQRGNRLTVPVSITGNARQPNVEVDASRILQSFGRG